MKYNNKWFSTHRSEIFTVSKFILGLSLIILLFSWNETSADIKSLFLKIKWEYLSILFFVLILMILVSCLKWNLFLKENHFNVSVFRLMVLYIIGFFFNNFMPSTIGGDLARSYLLGKQIESQPKAIASVFLERLTGLIALIFFAIFIALCNYHLMKQPLIVHSLIFISIFAIIFSIFLLNPKLTEHIFKFADKIVIARNIVDKFKKIDTEIKFFYNKRILFIKSMVYSTIFYLLTILQVYFTCITIGFFPSLLDIAVVTPIILLITSIPISPNNLGVWEWAFGIFLIKAGANLSEGLVVALTLRALAIAMSVIGAMLFLFEKADRYELKSLSS